MERIIIVLVVITFGYIMHQQSKDVFLYNTGFHRAVMPTWIKPSNVGWWRAKLMSKFNFFFGIFILMFGVMMVYGYCYAPISHIIHYCAKGFWGTSKNYHYIIINTIFNNDASINSKGVTAGKKIINELMSANNIRSENILYKELLHGNIDLSKYEKVKVSDDGIIEE